MRKVLSIILIANVVLCLFSACGVNEAKYQAYKGDKVVATVNGVNLYYSEVQTKKAFDVAQYNSIMDMIDKGKYDLDSHPAPVLKSEGELLDEMIQEEVLYQYYTSNDWDGEKYLLTRNEAIKQCRASAQAYKNYPDEESAQLARSIQEEYYKILKMDEDKWVQYRAPILMRTAGSKSFIKVYTDSYDLMQTMPEHLNMLTPEEKITELIQASEITKLLES